MAKKIICYTASEPYWDELAELYEEMNLTEFVEHILNEVPDAVYPEPEECDPSYITDEDDRYIMEYCDGMDDCVTIYQK